MSHAKQIRAVVAALTLVAAVIAASGDYVVQSGDTVRGIASQFGLSPSDLAKANNLSNPDLIRVGQILVIPGQSGGAAGTHAVSAGETLAKIAAQYGTTINALVEANGLSDPNLIRIGQGLQIPVSPGAVAIGGTPTAAVPEGATHTVSPGETLGGIAALYGTSVEALAAANGITNTSVIYVGTVLRLSGEGFVAEASTAQATVHTVAAGESLATVASRYGTTVNEIVTANGIPDPNLIRIGQQLQVPSASAGWVCPVAGARYFNDWGFPRSGGRSHEGNDLFAPRGTPVVAPVSGTVTFQNGSIGGLQFRLYGDDGTTYIGTHLDTIATDGYVTAGAPLGTVGDTGNAIGSNPMLHFEIHPANGAAENPYPTLQKYGC